MIYLLEQRISSKLESWDVKMLSQAGRTCLLKSVANMMANYGMSCLSMPSKVVKDISSKRSKFRWGRIFPSFAILLVGIKFVSRRVNTAFLSKLVWRIVSNPNTLLSQNFTAKYEKCKGWWNIQNSSQENYIWKGIKKGLKALEGSVLWSMGDGSNVRMSLDPLVPKSPEFCLS